MSKRFIRIACLLSGLMLLATMVYAGGVDPKEMSAQDPVVREKVSATPAQTSVAVSKARRAVVPAAKETPVVKEVPVSSSRPKVAATVSKDSWLLGSREGECAPLSSVNRKVKNIGSFETPQEFSRQMQQRGYQAFALDIGDVRDQVMRVKVPDLDLDLLFVRPEMCR